MVKRTVVVMKRRVTLLHQSSKAPTYCNFWIALQRFYMNNRGRICFTKKTDGEFEEHPNKATNQDKNTSKRKDNQNIFKVDMMGHG